MSQGAGKVERNVHDAGFGMNSFLDELDDVLISCKNLKQRMGVLLIDLSHIEMLNGSIGYRRIGEVLDSVHLLLRKMKRPTDYLTRVNDYRFALIITDIKFPAVVDLAVNKVHETLGGLRDLTGMETTVYPKVGAALYPQHGETAEQLLLEADTAARAAHLSNSGYILADDSACARIIENKLIETDLETGFNSTQFEVHYQPKVDLGGGGLLGAEALIRWDHPQAGAINPEQLMRIVEHGPMLQEISMWILNTALNQTAAMREKQPDFRIAVNMSPAFLSSPDFYTLVVRALRTWDVPPQNLVIEVTETAMLRDESTTVKNLQQLADDGVVISIDDFGTGFSSYCYLQTLPLDELKIDKSFIQSLDSDKRSRKIVRSMIALGNDFGIKVLAEGIETEQVMSLLSELGCHSGQGYLIARAMSADDFLEWMDTYPPSA